MKWYERFGLAKNPFTTDPFGSDYTLVNYSELIDDLFYYTASGSLVLLEGEEGTGKTMFLRQIIERFRGDGKVVYVNGDKLNKNLDVEEILNQKGGGLLGKVIGKKPKGMILLLDDVSRITEKTFEKIKYYFDQDYIRSVIFTAEDRERLHMTESIRDRIAGRSIRIPPLINFDALRIIRERFSDHFFLSDAVIMELFKISDGNIKRLLENCDIVCDFVVQQGRGEVLPKYINLALNLQEGRPENIHLHPSRAEVYE